jgi:hypothetical protein
VYISLAGYVGKGATLTAIKIRTETCMKCGFYKPGGMLEWKIRNPHKLSFVHLYSQDIHMFLDGIFFVNRQTLCYGCFPKKNYCGKNKVIIIWF